jgi:dATP pyrophosphohydrolase
MSHKLPFSVLVVIYTPELDVLLLERADVPGFWQSVTGARAFMTETWSETAVREVQEETGIDARSEGCVLSDWGLENVYEIYPRWRHRYASGVTSNTERVFGLQGPSDTTVTLCPREHTDCVWLPWQRAADRCFSPSNAEAVLWLPRMLAI